MPQTTQKMSLDISLTRTYDDGYVRTVMSENITHNLGHMATAAGIYDCLWRPDEHGLVHGIDLIKPLLAGLAWLRADPEYFQQYNSPNKWGLYVHFVPFVDRVLAGCMKYPDFDVEVSR
jgi:hypothetical protein